MALGRKVSDAVALAEQGRSDWRRLCRQSGLRHDPPQWQSVPDGQSHRTETSLVGNEGANQVDSVPPGDRRTRIDRDLSSSGEFLGNEKITNV